MLRMGTMGKIALGSLGVILAAKLFGKSPDQFPVQSDFSPEELRAMLQCVREGQIHAFEAIYRHRLPRASQKEIRGAMVRFQEYLQNGA